MTKITLKYGDIQFDLPSVRTSLKEQPEALNSQTTIQALMHPIERMLNTGNVEDAVSAMKKLSLSKLRQAMSTRVDANSYMEILHTTIALSSQIPEDCFSIDLNNRIVINNNQGINHDWDCDGDPVQVILFKELNNGDITSKGVIVKFPPTKLPPVWKQIPYIQPKISGITPEIFNQVMSKKYKVHNWETAMSKTFSHTAVGTTTLRWWSLILETTLNAIRSNSLEEAQSLSRLFDELNSEFLS